MPRAADIYTRPAGTDAVSDATISSTAYNRNVADVEQDLNFPRPIIAGGTGAATAVDALKNLGAVSEANVGASAGLLTLSATPPGNDTLKFIPYNGSRIKINGKLYEIPPAGVSTKGTVCYLDGVLSNLVPANSYFVYVFNNAGVLAIDFSLTAHETSTSATNAGTQTKIGDNTRTLIGQARFDGLSHFANDMQNRMLRSWFNRQAERLDFGGNFTAQRSTVSSAPAEINSEIRSNFFMWPGENVTLHFIGMVWITAGQFGYWAIAIDGFPAPGNMTTPYGGSGGAGGGGFWLPGSMSVSYSGLSSGLHQCTLFGWCTAGAQIFFGQSGVWAGLNGCIHT